LSSNDASKDIIKKSEKPFSKTLSEESGIIMRQAYAQVEAEENDVA
jgi:hypothetical protein